MSFLRLSWFLYILSQFYTLNIYICICICINSTLGFLFAERYLFFWFLDVVSFETSPLHFVRRGGCLQSLLALTLPVTLCSHFSSTRWLTKCSYNMTGSLNKDYVPYPHSHSFLLDSRQGVSMKLLVLVYLELSLLDRVVPPATRYFLA